MALIDEVTARYSNEQLLQWSNPLDAGATSVDTTLLTKACNDVEADFKTFAETTFDLTNDKHVSIAVRGAIEKLREWTGQLQPDPDREKLWQSSLKAIRNTEPRKRLTPATNSRLTASREDGDTGRTVRPAFDDNQFRATIPGQPWPTDDNVEPSS